MSLIINKYDFVALERESVNGQRMYACPDGSKVPSVTTILSATQSEEKTKALDGWRESIGEKAANDICTMAANRGTRVHKYMELYLETGELAKPGSNPHSMESNIMAKKIIDCGMCNINEVWGSEVALYYPGLYAGTCDALGEHKNQPAVFDYKQSNKIKKLEQIDDYFLQLTAYILAFNKMVGGDMKMGVILMCVRPPELSPNVWGDPTYQEFILTPEQFPYWEDKWWGKVEQYYLGQC